jgi:hypothetical protein
METVSHVCDGCAEKFLVSVPDLDMKLNMLRMQLKSLMVHLPARYEKARIFTESTINYLDDFKLMKTPIGREG